MNSCSCRGLGLTVPAALQIQDKTRSAGTGDMVHLRKNQRTLLHQGHVTICIYRSSNHHWVRFRPTAQRGGVRVSTTQAPFNPLCSGSLSCTVGGSPIYSIKRDRTAFKPLCNTFVLLFNGKLYCCVTSSSKRTCHTTNKQVWDVLL